ncbi:nSTAND1 domain-containing NTPase [Streptomyces sp. NPDC001275]
MEALLAAALVRIVGPTGAVGGSGFLLTPRQALTCAHVVSDALGRTLGEALEADARVVVELPLAGGARAEAVVEHWVPTRADGTGDIAVLRLRDTLAGAQPVPMAEPDGAMDHDVRVPGFTDRDPGGIWFTGRLRGRTAEGWVQLSGPDFGDAPIEEGFSGSPVWDKQTGAVVGMVVATHPAGARQSFLIPPRTLVEEIPALADVIRPASPFRGLAAFQEADAAVYFGRDAEADDITALLTGDAGYPAVTIIGSSGCGKSSLALAGVVPRLRARGYQVFVLRPDEGASPRMALSAEVARAAHPDSSGTELARQIMTVEELLAERGLPQTLRLVLGARADRVLVVLDQAETLLAGRDRDAAAEQTAHLLFTQQRPSGLRVLVTLRADFMNQALSHPALGPALGKGALRSLTPMSRDQLAEVIQRPLDSAPGVGYAPGLVQRILDDADAQPGVLPLLGFVLDRLWDDQTAGRLRFATYEDIGGVSGALGRHAENVWAASVGEADRDEAQRLLTALVRVRPGGGDPLRAVLTRAEAGPDRWRIAEAFARGRILVIGADSEHGRTAELAHEALIGAWPRLKDQVEQDERFLAWRARLQHAMDNWRETGWEEQQLLVGRRLEEAEEWLLERSGELSAQEREFIETGVRRRTEQQEAEERRRAADQEDQERRRLHDRRMYRIMRAGITVLAVVTVMALTAVLMIFKQNEALDGQLRRAASEQLAARAEQLDDVSLVTSGLFAAAAYRTAQEPEARSALAGQYLRMRHVERIVWDNHGAVEDVHMSEDGKRINVSLGTADGVGLELGMEKVRSFGLPDSSRLLALSPDGRISARAATRGMVSLGIAAGGKGFERTVVLRDGDTLRENTRAAKDLRFDGTGRKVLAAVPREGVMVWETQDGQRTGRTLRAPDGWETTQAWFGPEGTVIGRIAPQDSAEGTDGRLVRWTLDNGQRDDRTWGDDRTGAVTVSGDGRTLVRCTPEGLLQAWDLAGKPEIRNQYSTQQLGLVCPLDVPRLDRTGRYLLDPAQRFGAELGRYRFLVLDLAKGRPATLDLPAPTQQDAAVTGEAQLPAVSLAGPPDRMRAAISVGSTVLVARIPRPSPFDSAMLTSRIRTVDADHGRVVSVDADGRGIRLWDLRSHQLLAAVQPSRPLAALYAAYSPDGRRLLSATEDGRAVLTWKLAGPDGPALEETEPIVLPRPPGIDPTDADRRTGLTPAWTALTFDDEDHAVISAVSYVMRWDLARGKQAGEIYRPREQDPREVSRAASRTWGAARPGHGQAAVRTAAGAEIVIWDFARGEEAATVEAEVGTVKQFGFDPTGRMLAVLDYDGGVRVWDMDEKKWFKPLTYEGAFWLGAFSSESSLSTISARNEYSVWDVRSRAEGYHFTLGYGFTAAVTRGGTEMGLIDGSDGRLLSLRPEAWMDRVCELAGRGMSKGEKALAPPGSRTDGLCG